MLVSRLLRSLLRFLSPGIVGEDGGGAAAAPAAEPSSAPAPAEPAAASAAPAAPSAPADPFAGVREAIDSIGAAPNADPATPGQPRDPSGRFASQSQAAAGATAQPAAKPEAAPPAQGQPPAAKPGEVDLTPPEGMTDRAKERWAQLTERVKQVSELERRATEASQQLESVRTLVAQSGLAPNEFSEMLDMARLFKAGDAKALQMLDGLRSELATRLGVDVPGVDALANHPDLKQKVDGLLMTREDALEIARLRQESRQSRGQLDSITAEQREMQQFQQNVQNAATSMETALQKRAGTAGHDDKLKYIHQHFSNPENMQRFVKTYQPHQWEAVVMTMYDAYTPQVAPAPAVPQPLRPGAVRPGAPVSNGPVTMQSALENAFSSLGL